MKKIMFNDLYGLTQAVLEGRKTMTRRLCKEYKTGKIIHAEDVDSCRFYQDENLVEFVKKNGEIVVSVPPYRIGEIIAVAQPYKDIISDILNYNGYNTEIAALVYKKHKGWNNKMFVKPIVMPHQIRITNIKVERLQDISNEDCLREGVYYCTEPPKFHESDHYCPWPPTVTPYKRATDNFKFFCNPQFAFAYLIDKVSGKGTWESNPFVYAYEFELVK